MNVGLAQRAAGALCLCLLLHLPPAGAAQAAHDYAAVRAYVDDACIIDDEPFFLPMSVNKDAADPTTAKFLPLIGAADSASELERSRAYNEARHVQGLEPIK
jgi:hypothetical protein